MAIHHMRITSAQSRIQQHRQTCLPLQFPFCEIQQHLPASHYDCPPERREIKRACQSICEAKPKHRRDPTSGVFKSEARFVHLVLLDFPTAKVVDAALRIDFRHIRSRSGGVSQLGAFQDVEVVICSVSARMPLGSDRSAWGKKG